MARMTQGEWDDLLVRSFYEHPDAPMYRLYVDRSEIEGLKRIPNEHTWQTGKTVTVFICEFLPKLADVLWKSKVANVGRIVNALSNSSMDTRDERSQFSNSLAALRRSAFAGAKAARAATLGRGLHASGTKSLNGSAWGVCK